MVKIRPADQPAQRFLFRENNYTEPSIYQKQVMIFGAVSSPFCAQYVKNKNAMQFKDIYPEAVEGIVGKHYMDDYLDCANSEEEAIKKVNEVISIHKIWGFDMRGRVSNSQKLLDTIPKELVIGEKILDNPDKTHRYFEISFEFSQSRQ